QQMRYAEPEVAHPAPMQSATEQDQCLTYDHEGDIGSMKADQQIGEIGRQHLSSYLSPIREPNSWRNRSAVIVCPGAMSTAASSLLSSGSSKSLGSKRIM